MVGFEYGPLTSAGLKEQRKDPFFLQVLVLQRCLACSFSLPVFVMNGSGGMGQARR